MRIDILSQDDSTMYLGRKLNLANCQATEMDSRIGLAWKAFMARKGELCNKRYPLRDRLRLFEATVSKCALYGIECWTLTEEDRRTLRTTQRKMLRWIVGIRRKMGEGLAVSSDTAAARRQVPAPQIQATLPHRRNRQTI